MLLMMAESDGISSSSKESESDSASSGFVERPARMCPFVMYRGECSREVAMPSILMLVCGRRQTPRKHAKTTSAIRIPTEATMPTIVKRSRRRSAQMPTELHRVQTPMMPTGCPVLVADTDVTFAG